MLTLLTPSLSLPLCPPTLNDWAQTDPIPLLLLRHLLFQSGLLMAHKPVIPLRRQWSAGCHSTKRTTKQKNPQIFWCSDNLGLQNRNRLRVEVWFLHETGVCTQADGSINKQPLWDPQREMKLVQRVRFCFWCNKKKKKKIIMIIILKKCTSGRISLHFEQFLWKSELIPPWFLRRNTFMLTMLQITHQREGGEKKLPEVHNTRNLSLCFGEIEILHSHSLCTSALVNSH